MVFYFLFQVVYLCILLWNNHNDFSLCKDYSANETVKYAIFAIHSTIVSIYNVKY